MRRGFALSLGCQADLDAQVAALADFGCDEVTAVSRETLERRLGGAQPGHELVAARLEVFGRTPGRLVTRLHDLTARGVLVTLLGGEPLTLGGDRRLMADELLERLTQHTACRPRRPATADARG